MGINAPIPRGRFNTTQQHGARNNEINVPPDKNVYAYFDLAHIEYRIIKRDVLEEACMQLNSLKMI